MRASDTTRSAIRQVLVTADTDDFGRAIPLDVSSAERVVSLNPTATEIIFAIGAESRLVGRSAWDEFPPAAKAVPAVGNGIRPNVEAVLGLKPTLVILYATADNRSAADAFTRAGVRTMAFRVDHIAQFMTLTRRLGAALGAVDRAATVVDSVTRTLARVREVTRGASVRTVVWPLWQQPVMVVGGGSYLDELLEIAGGRNVFHDLAPPSPVASLEEIARRNPDWIITSVKSRKIMRSQPQWRAVRAVRDNQWIIDDPDVTGRPSVVLGMAATELAHALHPELGTRLPPRHRAAPR
ncbi:MAG: ABC transporter substrate-binding protein [Gemmatimonadaceae bacterium]|nr:ABC transporter substrate-binding protein [Gemmatimonadaceae bacterium]